MSGPLFIVSGDPLWQGRSEAFLPCQTVTRGKDNPRTAPRNSISEHSPDAGNEVLLGSENSQSTQDHYITTDDAKRFSGARKHRHKDPPFPEPVPSKSLLQP